MTILIEKKTEEPLLNKLSIEASADSEGKTPSREEVRKELASQLSVSEDLVVVESIYPIFGLTRAKVRASVYKEQKTKEFFKRKVKKVAAGA